MQFSEAARAAAGGDIESVEADGFTEPEQPTGQFVHPAMLGSDTTCRGDLKYYLSSNKCEHR